MANDNLNVSETTSQNQAILQYLKEGNKITSLKAYELFGCTRLPSRVVDIEQILGYPLPRKRIKVPNRFGKEVWVMEYWFVDRTVN